MTLLQRTTIIDTALPYKPKVKIVYVDCSVQEAIRRNAKREENKQVKREVIERYSRKFEIPDITECHTLEIIK